MQQQSSGSSIFNVTIKGTFYSEDVGEIWNRCSNEVNKPNIVPSPNFLISNNDLLRAGTDMF